MGQGTWLLITSQRVPSKLWSESQAGQLPPGRMMANPLAGIPKANEKADPRRQRRALTEDELRRLLRGAQQRPLLDAMTIRRGKDAGKPLAKLVPYRTSHKPRQPGAWRGKVKIADDFDALPEDIAAAFRGEKT